MRIAEGVRIEVAPVVEKADDDRVAASRCFLLEEPSSARFGWSFEALGSIVQPEG